MGFHYILNPPRTVERDRDTGHRQPHESRNTKSNELRHKIYNNVVCATSKGSDQPAPSRSLIRTIAGRLTIL